MTCSTLYYAAVPFAVAGFVMLTCCVGFNIQLKRRKMKAKREEKNRQKYGARSWQVAITPSSAAAALNMEGATITLSPSGTPPLRTKRTKATITE